MNKKKRKIGIVLCVISVAFFVATVNLRNHYYQGVHRVEQSEYTSQQEKIELIDLEKTPLFLMALLSCSLAIFLAGLILLFLSRKKRRKIKEIDSEILLLLFRQEEAKIQETMNRIFSGRRIYPF